MANEMVEDCACCGQFAAEQRTGTKTKRGWQPLEARPIAGRYIAPGQVGYDAAYDTTAGVGSTASIATGFWRGGLATFSAGQRVARCIPNADQTSDDWSLRLYDVIQDVTSAGDPASDTTHFRPYLVTDSVLRQRELVLWPGGRSVEAGELVQDSFVALRTAMFPGTDTEQPDFFTIRRDRPLFTRTELPSSCFSARRFRQLRATSTLEILSGGTVGKASASCLWTKNFETGAVTLAADFYDRDLLPAPLPDELPVASYTVVSRIGVDGPVTIKINGEGWADGEHSGAYRTFRLGERVRITWRKTSYTPPILGIPDPLISEVTNVFRCLSDTATDQTWTSAPGRSTEPFIAGFVQEVDGSRFDEYPRACRVSFPVWPQDLVGAESNALSLVAPYRTRFASCRLVAATFEAERCQLIFEGRISQRWVVAMPQGTRASDNVPFRLTQEVVLLGEILDSEWLATVPMGPWTEGAAVSVNSVTGGNINPDVQTDPTHTLVQARILSLAGPTICYTTRDIVTGDEHCTTRPMPDTPYRLPDPEVCQQIIVRDACECV